MVKRREFITLLGGAAAMWPLAVQAQSERMRKVGWLQASGVDQELVLITAFRESLAQLGWTEGINLQLELRRTLADVDRARTYASELVGMKPDVIVASNAQMVELVQDRTRTIPIVFVAIPDSVVSRLVGSVARPTSNATGFINFEPSMAGKWLELLKGTSNNDVLAA